MGFLTGSLTFSRFQITKDQTGAFGPKHVELLVQHQIGETPPENPLEQADIGFIAGDHIFDRDFRVEKNVIGEALHWGIRIDSAAIPASIKRAWMKIELAGIMHENQGSRPSREQREEAEAAVHQKCLQEVEQGKFRKMSTTPILWDAAESILYVGTQSEKMLETATGLVESVFGLELAALSPTRLAVNFADDDTDTYEYLVSTRPSVFVEDGPEHVSWWNGMGDNHDYLGNEFLLWLWWHWETQSSVIDLPDESDLSGMFSKTLLLDCPWGESGKETISSISPVVLPEALMAIRMGKQPRKAGLNLTRDGEQFEFNLQAESFGINAARMVNQAEANPGNDPEVRVQSIRNLGTALDFLYETFLERRLSSQWDTQVLPQIQNWLKQETAPRRVVEAA